jgi:1-aminocyclopropane-1-carboxylate deaminase
MIEKNQIADNTKILAIHSGGIQAIEGFNQMQQKKGKPTINFKMI